MLLLLETIAIVLPVFLVISLGVCLKRIKLLDDSFLYQTNQLVYLVFLPILLFYKIGTADFTSYFDGALVIGSSLVIFIGFSLSYLYAGWRKYPAAQKAVFHRGHFAEISPISDWPSASMLMVKKGLQEQGS